MLPSSVAPSPKKHVTTWPAPRFWKANAQPVAIGTWVPTTAEAPNTPASGATKCIDPPLPRAHPVTLPYSSAIIRRRSPPFAR